MIETESYSKELFGAQKKPESLSGIVQSAKFLKFKFGTVRLVFCGEEGRGCLLYFQFIFILIYLFKLNLFSHFFCVFIKVDINFGAPISIAQYLANQQLERTKKAPKHDPNARRLIQALAYRYTNFFPLKNILLLFVLIILHRVLYECNKVSVVRPTSLVATALLTHPGELMLIILSYFS